MGDQEPCIFFKGPKRLHAAADEALCAVKQKMVVFVVFFLVGEAIVGDRGARLFSGQGPSSPKRAVGLAGVTTCACLVFSFSICAAAVQYSALLSGRSSAV